MLLDVVDKFASWDIILGSKSPRRAEILKHSGLHFRVLPSNFAEDLPKKDKSPAAYCEETCRMKVDDIINQLESVEMKETLVIGSDTIVVLENVEGQSAILEKPSDFDSACDMLRSLSGKSHTVISAVTIAVRQGGASDFRQRTFSEQTTVTFDELSDALIEAYVRTGEPMDKAGGYGIQAVGGTFVKGITGCYFNVMGFPLHRFCKELREFVEL